MNIEQLPRTVEMKRTKDGYRFVMIDQTKLPDELTYISTSDWHEVVTAIAILAVRGAPALGVAGAGALALWLFENAHDKEGRAWVSQVGLDEAASIIARARPTAVNLMWGTKRMHNAIEDALQQTYSKDQLCDVVFEFVKDMEAEDEAVNRALGAYGAELLKPQSRVLTHCNAGSLATVFYGTALGVIYAAAEQGKIERVYADETRPVGQGARLTAWELAQAGIPVTLECDNMAGALMQAGKIDAVIVGADRIARNGDTANKIGTYSLAVLARHHHIPFYIAAPTSTVDTSIATGAQIPIEQRSETEVLPHPLQGVDVYNPAFDVTPAELISAWITEKGVFKS